MKETNFAVVILIVILLEIVGVLIILPGNSIEKLIDGDIASAMKYASYESVEKGIQWGGEVKKLVFIKSGVKEAFYKHYIAKEMDGANSEREVIGFKIFKWVKERFEVLMEYVACVGFRIYVYMHFIQMTWPVIVAVIVDALIRRQIDIEESKTASSVVYHFLKTAIVLTIFLGLILIFVPLNIGVNAPLIIFLAVLGGIWGLIKNVQDI